MEDEHGSFLPSDEEIDSDVEGYLYSQLHYSTELKLGPDSELVIEEEEASDDDGKLPDIIPVSNNEPKNNQKNLWAISDKDLKGADRYLQSLGRNKRYYLDTRKSNIKCSNCHQTGHFVQECPEAMKEEVCHLCGLKGHLRWSCPNDICYNCFEVGHISKTCSAPRKNNYAVCKRCWGRGHNKFNCPEIWRQYHLTDKDSSSITKPKFGYNGILKSIRKIRYCFNCGEEGHFGHDCKQERPNKRPVNSPFTVHYDRCPFKNENANKGLEGQARTIKDIEPMSGDSSKGSRDIGRETEKGPWSHAHKEDRSKRKIDINEERERPLKEKGQSEDRTRLLKDSQSWGNSYGETKGKQKKRGNDEDERDNKIGRTCSERVVSRDVTPSRRDRSRKIETMEKSERIRLEEKRDKDGRNIEKISDRSGKRKSSSREESSHRREESSHSREESSHRREGTSHRREESSHRREETSHRREETSHRREGTSHRREESSHRREETSHRREETSHRREGTSHRRDGLNRAEDNDDRKKVKRILLTDNEDVEGNKTNENKIKTQNKDIVKIKRVKTSRTEHNALAGDAVDEKEPDKKAFCAEGNGTAKGVETPFKIMKSSEVIDDDQRSEMQFIEIDVYVESDSSLEIREEERDATRTGKKRHEMAKHDREAENNMKSKSSIDVEKGIRDVIINDNAIVKESEEVSRPKVLKDVTKMDGAGDDVIEMMKEQSGKAIRESLGKINGEKRRRDIDNVCIIEKSGTMENGQSGGILRNEANKDNEAKSERTNTADKTEQVIIDVDALPPYNYSMYSPVSSEEEGNANSDNDNVTKRTSLDGRVDLNVMRDNAADGSRRVMLDRGLGEERIEYSPNSKADRYKGAEVNDVTLRKAENETRVVVTSGNEADVGTDGLPKRRIENKQEDLEVSTFFDKSKQKADAGRACRKNRSIINNKRSASPAHAKISDNDDCRVSVQSNTTSARLPDFIRIGDTDEELSTQEPIKNTHITYVDGNENGDVDHVNDDDRDSSDAENFQFSNLFMEKDSSSEDDLRKSIDTIRSRKTVTQIPSTSDMTSESMNEDVPEDTQEEIHVTDLSMRKLLNFSDTRKVDLTRYDPNQCGDADVSTYGSFSNPIRKRHAPSQSTNQVQRKVFIGKPNDQSNDFARSNTSVAATAVTGNPKDTTKSKKRKMKKKQAASKPAVRPNEHQMWAHRVATSLEIMDAPPQRHISGKDKGKVGSKESSIKSNSIIDDSNLGDNGMMDELHGKGLGKKARKRLKRKWREAGMKNGGTEWFEEMTNVKKQKISEETFNDGKPKCKQAVRNVTKTAGKNNPNSAIQKKFDKGKNMLMKEHARSSTPVHRNDKKQGSQRKFINRDSKINRGFKTSDTAKRFGFNDYL